MFHSCDASENIDPHYDHYHKSIFNGNFVTELWEGGRAQPFIRGHIRSLYVLKNINFCKKLTSSTHSHVNITVNLHKAK